MTDPPFYEKLMLSCYSKPESEWTALTQGDFREGTVRLLEGGCYYLAEVGTKYGSCLHFGTDTND